MPYALKNARQRSPELDRYAMDLEKIGKRHNREAPISSARPPIGYPEMNAIGPLPAPPSLVSALSDRLARLAEILPRRNTNTETAREDGHEVLVNILGSMANQEDRFAVANRCIQRNDFVTAAKLIFPQKDVSTPLMLYFRSVQLYYERSPVGLRDRNWERVPDYSVDSARYAEIPKFAADKPEGLESLHFHLLRYPLVRRLDCDGRKKNVP